MITVRRCPRVAGVVMIVASLSGAGDAPESTQTPKRLSPLYRANSTCKGAEWTRHATAV